MAECRTVRFEPPPPDIVDRLARHRTIGQAPPAELQWLAAHGRLRLYEAGENVAHKGTTIEESGMGLEIVLSGRFAIFVDYGGAPRKVLEWQGGDIGGRLPFSRMARSPGEAVTETAVEILSLPPECFADLIRECPVVTGLCVHVMVDRARAFNTNDWRVEKMASLGKLAAGLAHELNNPASAVARSGQALYERTEDVDRAARALAAAHLTDAQLAAIDRVRETGLDPHASASRSPIERADREDDLAAWLTRHGANVSAAEPLADTAVAIPQLDELAKLLPREALTAALDWVAASREIRTLASENERAGLRIAELVGAIKRLTYVDRAPVSEPTDIEQGLRDTLAILGHKTRAKSVRVSIDLAPDLPRVHAIGGELNQVWMNILDNALDAVTPGGAVQVTAQPEGRYLVVRVIDDGPGILPEHVPRVFDPFFTTKAPGEGTGLGLEVARARARGHGGDIEVDSRPGRTEFRVLLPLPEHGPGQRPI